MKPVVSLSTRPKRKSVRPILLKPEQAAEALGVSVRFLHNLQRQGAVPFLKLGTLIRYSPAALERWALEQSTASQGGSTAA